MGQFCSFFQFNLKVIGPVWCQGICFFSQEYICKFSVFFWDRFWGIIWQTIHSLCCHGMMWFLVLCALIYGNLEFHVLWVPAQFSQGPGTYQTYVHFFVLQAAGGGGEGKKNKFGQREVAFSWRDVLLVSWQPIWSTGQGGLPTRFPGHHSVEVLMLMAP